MSKGGTGIGQEQRKARRHRKVTFATSVAKSESAVTCIMEIMICVACSAHKSQSINLLIYNNNSSSTQNIRYFDRTYIHAQAHSTDITGTTQGNSKDIEDKTLRNTEARSTANTEDAIISIERAYKCKNKEIV